MTVHCLTNLAESVLSYSIVRPAESDEPMPVIVFSVPMVWGRRHVAPPANYISEYLAHAGYLVIRIVHRDSDRDIFPDDIDNVDDRYAYISINIRQPERSHARFLDIPFLLDCLEQWNVDHPALAGRIDMARIGLSGNSFGATTALAAIGEAFGNGVDYRDSRAKAIIAYSRSPSLDPFAPEETCARITVPVMHMCGSHDISWSEPGLPEDRVLTYDHINATNQYRLVLKGADHVTFPGGRGDAGTARPREQRNHQLIKSVSLAFWDAYLRDDAAAKKWLREELPGVLGRDGKFEWR